VTEFFDILFLGSILSQLKGLRMAEMWVRSLLCIRLSQFCNRLNQYTRILHGFRNDSRIGSMLGDAPEGTFLIRLCTRGDALAISLKAADNQILHIEVLQSEIQEESFGGICRLILGAKCFSAIVRRTGGAIYYKQCLEQILTDTRLVETPGSVSSTTRRAYISLAALFQKSPPQPSASYDIAETSASPQPPESPTLILGAFRTPDDNDISMSDSSRPTTPPTLDLSPIEAFNSGEGVTEAPFDDPEPALGGPTIHLSNYNEAWIDNLLQDVSFESSPDTTTWGSAQEHMG